MAQFLNYVGTFRSIGVSVFFEFFRVKLRFKIKTQSCVELLFRTRTFIHYWWHGVTVTYLFDDAFLRVHATDGQLFSFHCTARLLGCFFFAFSLILLFYEVVKIKHRGLDFFWGRAGGETRGDFRWGVTWGHLFPVRPRSTLFHTIKEKPSHSNPIRKTQFVASDKSFLSFFRQDISFQTITEKIYCTFNVHCPFNVRKQLLLEHIHFKASINPRSGSHSKSGFNGTLG
jgi:hypothetical protein